MKMRVESDGNFHRYHLSNWNCLRNYRKQVCFSKTEEQKEEKESVLRLSQPILVGDSVSW